MRMPRRTRPPRAIHGAVSQRLFFDRTLQWAKQNPLLAQQCLEVSPLDGVAVAASGPPNPHSSSAPRSPRTFLDYWNRRGWTFDSLERVDERIFGQKLVTHVLTAPLTLVSKLELLRPLDSQLDSSVSNAESGDRCVRLCCAGARAEASLPVQYWKEVLVVLKWSSPAANVAVTIDFVGPDVVPRPPVSLEHRGSTLQLRWPYAGKFHEYVAKEARDSLHYHGIVLFNPGLGHPNLKSDWRPTIDLLLERLQHSSEHANVLLTAHSEVDASRESTYLKQNFGMTIDYGLNPFASEITYEDPFDKSHVVRPNHFAALF